MNRKELKGIIPAMVTPFDHEENLDLESAKKITNWLIDEGVHGLFIAGTNGEAHLMSHDEVVELTETVVKETNGRVVVISGAGRCSTKETIELAKRLKDAGTDYISLVSPSYLVPSQEDLYKHYETIAKAVDANFIIYNIPSQTGLEISPAVVQRLAKIKNICGVKDSGGNFDIQKQYIDLTVDEDFDVLNGSDSLVLDTLKAGATGGVMATANVIPKIEIKLYNYFVEGNLEKAQEQREKMDPLRVNLKKAVAPSVMKKAMNMMGLPAGIPRMPVSEVTDENLIKDIDEMIKHYESIGWE